MILDRAHRIELLPNAEQLVQLRRSCGVARFAYNWGLAEYKKSLDAFQAAKAEDPETKSKVTKVNDLKKRWNSEKPEWTYESPKDANQQPFANLQAALTNFFRDRKKKAGHKAGFPDWKKRGQRDGFYCSNDKVKIPLGANQVRLPVIGWVRTAEHFKPASKKALHINSISVSRSGEHWYASVSYRCEIDEPSPDTTRPAACVDLGLRTFATILDSDGWLQEIEAPQPLKKALVRLRKRQRALSRYEGNLHRKKNKRHSCKHKKVAKSVKRGVKLSREERLKRRLEKKTSAENPGEKVLHTPVVHKNFEKRKKEVARLHRRVANIRNDFLHKLTTRLLRENQAVVIEDLSITGWAANRKWARKVGDLGLRTFRTLLEYKAPLHASRVPVLSRWYASSKTCDECREINKELMFEKLWICPSCGAEHQRDIAAVSNMLQDVGLPLLVELQKLKQTGCGLLTVSPGTTVPKSQVECPAAHAVGLAEGQTVAKPRFLSYSGTGYGDADEAGKVIQGAEALETVCALVHT